MEKRRFQQYRKAGAIGEIDLPFSRLFQESAFRCAGRIPWEPSRKTEPRCVADSTVCLAAQSSRKRQ